MNRRLSASKEGERLPAAFFERSALEVAPDLLGARLVHVYDARLPPYIGRVVETEAYCGPNDRACHARFGVTARTRTLYGAPGHAYVFLIYGMYDCFNAVTLAEGEGHAVLIRACEPLSGFSEGVRLDGPGRLSRAMSITRAHDGLSFASGAIYFAKGDRAARVGSSARIGVSYAGEDAALPWRFFDETSKHVSKLPRAASNRG